ncbi:MAG TPA: NAD-dependent epimerase/dehydratase family protein [Bacillota bacterium]|nr:NAD-dependent epimerase/dehydratase family protein [Bacillota bacterium]
MKILVTGGAGFIGTHVVESLLQLGYETIVVDHLQSGHKQFVPPKAHLIEMNINSLQMEEVFSKEKPDIVIHLAAQVDVNESLRDPIYDAEQNILGTVRLLHYSRKYNVQKIIFSSSCAVYGETADYSITESFPLQPLSFYGLSKYASEKYIQLFNRLYQLPFTILRYANVYGPRQSTKGEGGVISTFLKKILNREDVWIFGDGKQTRDFVYVKDVAQANVKAIQKGNGEIFNIGCNMKTSINELLETMQSLSSIHTSPIYKPSREGDILHSRLDNSKAASLLNWKPSYDLCTGLTELFQEYDMI